jgi:hypothetical protein
MTYSTHIQVQGIFNFKLVRQLSTNSQVTIELRLLFFKLLIILLLLSYLILC